jgi:signal transduction histidine kinase
VFFRVTTEALTNIRKHAGTTRAQVQLERHDNQIQLTIQDWGCGFITAAAPTGARLGERIGLRGMRERIEFLGGRWQIVSEPGAGTLIIATVPLSPNDEGGTRYGS